MPNRRYEAGRRFEWKRKKFWEESGFLVIRAAGSHSPIDLVCISDNSLVCVQCKIVKTHAELENLLDKLRAAPRPVGKKWSFVVDAYVRKTRAVESIWL